MRTIKFRGRGVEGAYKGVWGYGDLDRQNMWRKGFCTIWLEDKFYGSGFSVDPETVGQYTGLKDKNGNGVYEDDIVKRHCNVYGLDDIGVVKYDDEEARFVLYCKKRHYAKSLPFMKQQTINDGQCTIEETFTYEIIGNIHDNPELLKETTN